MDSSRPLFSYAQDRDMSAGGGDFVDVRDSGADAVRTVEAALFGVDTVALGMFHLAVEGLLAPPSGPIGGLGSVHDVHLDANEPRASSTPSNAPRNRLPVRASIVRRRAPRKRRRAVRRVPPVPRRERVWCTCHICGERNHVRRLFCVRCIRPRRSN